MPLQLFLHTCFRARHTQELHRKGNDLNWVKETMPTVPTTWRFTPCLKIKDLRGLVVKTKANQTKKPVLLFLTGFSNFLSP
jgi:hypothetical protein